MQKLSNRIVTVNRSPVIFGPDSYPALDRLVKSMHPHRVFILVDENTHQHCMPQLFNSVTTLAGAKVLKITGGESSKSFDNAVALWKELLTLGTDRSGLIINLGGGVVSDLGGFVASNFLRGIRYINIPTSLMAMSDAAIGGKTAVNVGFMKNQVGSFYPPAAIFIFPLFLETLSRDHLRSGFAEIVKSALIGNEGLWKKIKAHPVSEVLDIPADSPFWHHLILATATLKNRIVERDFREKKERKALNFGHTIGHALESYFMQTGAGELFHGDAVAAGMMGAVWLSAKKNFLSPAQLEVVCRYLREGFPRIKIENDAIPEVLGFMKSDKKRMAGLVTFTLLAKPGTPVLNIPCSEDEVTEALEFINSFSPSHHEKSLSQ